MHTLTDPFPAPTKTKMDSTTSWRRPTRHKLLSTDITLRCQHGLTLLTQEHQRAPIPPPRTRCPGASAHPATPHRSKDGPKHNRRRRRSRPLVTCGRWPRGRRRPRPCRQSTRGRRAGSGDTYGPKGRASAAGLTEAGLREPLQWHQTWRCVAWVPTPRR